MVAPPTEREKVLFGKDGWLFLQRDSNDVIGQHVGRVRMERGDRRAWEEVLRRRVSIMNRLGFAWLCQVAPDKESVYAEYLPTGIVPARRRTVHRFLRIASSLRAPVVYPLSDLMGGKRAAELYSRTDTHWNQRGAYIAYRSLCQNLAERGIRIPVVDPRSLSWLEQASPGDLGGKMNPPITGRAVIAELAHHSGSLAFDNRVHNHGRVMVFTNETAARHSCVAFGESFTNHLLLFLKESFRRLVFVHSSMLISEILEHERPDVVLSLPLERFLVRVPSDEDGLAHLAQTVKEKVKGGEIQKQPLAYLRNCPSASSAASQSQVGAIPW